MKPKKNTKVFTPKKSDFMLLWKMRDALVKVEWIEGEYFNEYYCPVCSVARGKQHLDQCSLGIALSSVNKRLEPT